MRKFYFVSLLASFWMFTAVSAVAQTSYFTKQVILVNGGNYSDPDDYVTVASYDPASGETTEFATIYTQSVQDVLINAPFAYVAAQDSIVKLNIDTYEKVTSVAAPGVNKLVTNGDVLVASFWYPTIENFVRTYTMDDLSLITEFGGVSGEASDMLVMGGNYVMVAIPGAYGSTTGKSAVIDLANNVVMTESDLGEFFKDIGFFASWDVLVTVFMRSEYGNNTFRAATINLQGEVVDQFTYDEATLVNPTGQSGDKFYLEINNGIAEYDLVNHVLTNTSVVSQQVMSIGASVMDTINKLFYLTTTDFFSSGEGFIYNLSGENAGSFEAGISAQAIAVDYRENTGINENLLVKDLNIYPNPASTTIHFTGLDNSDVTTTEIMNLTGKVICVGKEHKEIDISSLHTGIYFVKIYTTGSVYTGKFIKN